MSPVDSRGDDPPHPPANPVDSRGVASPHPTVRYAREERVALAALLDETGPDAPTLCTGWQTGIWRRIWSCERRPDAAAGVLGGPLAGHTARTQARLGERLTYAQLVRAFRTGPRLSPFALPGLDEKANTVEFFVHHEDVRRAAPGWEPRTSPGCPARCGRLKGARLFLR